MDEQQIRADERERVAQYLTKHGMGGPASYVQGMTASPAPREPLERFKSSVEAYFDAFNRIIRRVNEQGEAIRKLGEAIEASRVVDGRGMDGRRDI